MYIDEYMTRNPQTISPETSISEAREILSSGKFRHLPVVNEQQRLIGMITDRDLRSAYPSSVLTEEEKQACIATLSKKPVSSIMSTKFVTLNRQSTLDDALLLLDRDNVGALPVLDNHEHVIGIFSIRDLVKAYKQLYGLGERGSSLVVIEDDNGDNPLTRIVETLESHNISFTRLVRPQYNRQKDSPGLIYLRVNTYNINAVHSALRKAGFTVATPPPTAK